VWVGTMVGDWLEVGSGEHGASFLPGWWCHRVDV
jgi:hypothetical protein